MTREASWNRQRGKKFISIGIQEQKKAKLINVILGMRKREEIVLHVAKSLCEQEDSIKKKTIRKRYTYWWDIHTQQQALRTAKKEKHLTRLPDDEQVLDVPIPSLNLRWLLKLLDRQAPSDLPLKMKTMDLSMRHWRLKKAMKLMTMKIFEFELGSVYYLKKILAEKISSFINGIIELFSYKANYYWIMKI